MKNLKKVLALGLALVMLLGMFTVASAAETKKVATDLSDFDKVVNKEAVSLMVDLGVIKGLPDGSYAPANTIDRASWSKMVYYVMTNEEDASVYIPAGPVFADVTDQHWACGEIAYLKTLGIVAGDGTSFRPNDEITMVEAYKMMLTGIGYDAKYEKYENDANWAGNVMKDASRLGLTDKISAKQSDKLTRDVAAQIVYNALSCNVKELDEKQIGNIGTMVDGYKTYGTLGYENFKIAKKVLTVTSVDKDGIATFSGSDASKMNDVKASASDVGRRVQIWANVTKDADEKLQYNSAKSTAAFPADIEAVKVVTGGMDITKAFVKGNDDYVGMVADTDHIKWYLNGAEVTQGAEDATLAAAAKKSGNVVEFYDDDESGNIDLVKVTTWAAAKIGDVKTRTNSDDKLEVSVAKVTGGYVLADRVVGYTGLAKDDVVLFNVSVIGSGSNTENVYTIEKLSSIDGKVTANSSKGEITVNSTKYEKSDVASGDDISKDFDQWSDFDSEFSFYLGKDGKVVYGQITEEGIDSSKVAMILDTLFVTGGDIDVSNTARMKLLFTDGTTENVTVTKVNGLKVIDDGETPKQEEGKDVEVVIGTVKATARKTFYNFKVDKDGKYELTEMDDTNQSEKWKDIVSNDSTDSLAIANKPNFTSTYASDSKTLFIVDKQDKDDNSTFYTYTGYSNVPKMNAGAVEQITIATEANASAAKYVFIQTTAFADDRPEGLVYLRDNGYTYNKADDCYEINIVDAEGKATTLKVATNVAIDSTTISFAADALNDHIKQFYKIDSVTDGVVDKLVKAVDESKKIVNVADATDLSVANGVVTWDSNNSYEITDSTVMVWVDLKEDSDNKGDATKAVYGSCGTFTAGDLSTSADEYPGGTRAVVVLNDDVAEFIYVERNSTPAAASEG